MTHFCFGNVDIVGQILLMIKLFVLELPLHCKLCIVMYLNLENKDCSCNAIYDMHMLSIRMILFTT